VATVRAALTKGAKAIINGQRGGGQRPSKAWIWATRSGAASRLSTS
jgi:hypothetical protein